MISEADFTLLAAEVKARSGAILPRELAGAIELRLQPLARRNELSAVSELIGAARIRPDGRLWNAIADNLVQCETRFFRDRGMFQRLREDIIPSALMRRGHERIRIWSAACATGQEPYSIAIILDEMRAEGLNPAAEIMGTDFSERLIEKARSGLYTQFEVQRGLPIRKLIAHFEKSGDLWRIADRLRAAVRFETHNLLKHPVHLGQFDIILLCNVLSNFDAETRIAVLEQAASILHPEGCIVLGAGETLPEGASGFTLADGVVKIVSAARVAA